MYLERSGVGSREWGVGLRRRQGGWLMPVAAFIIVVMGLLAAGMARVGSQTSMAGALEQISLQTFYAAESGAQYAMNRLFYSTTTAVTSTTAAIACTNIEASSGLSLHAEGMNNCEVDISCQESVSLVDGRSYFLVESRAVCGSGAMSAERIVQVSAAL